MPWSCCGEELHDDQRDCPACGKTKQRWTVQFDRTRVFSLGPKDWDLETIDYTPDSELVPAGPADGSPSTKEEEEDEEWELEEVDYTPGDEPGPPVEAAPPLEEPSTREETEEEDEEEDWDLEGIDAPSAGSESGPAAAGGGQAEASTREDEEQEQEAEPEDEDWEVELLDTASE